MATCTEIEQITMMIDGAPLAKITAPGLHLMLSLDGEPESLVNTVFRISEIPGNIPGKK